MIHLILSSTIFFLALTVMAGLTGVTVLAQETTSSTDTSNMTDSDTSNMTDNDNKEDMEPEAGMISRKD